MFAQREKHNPIDTTLPQICYFFSTAENSLVVVKRGEIGYYELTADFLAHNRLSALELNAPLGVTPAQAQAMKSGSIFGFHVPASRASTWEERLNRSLQDSDLVL